MKDMEKSGDLKNEPSQKQILDSQWQQCSATPVITLPAVFETQGLSPEMPLQVQS